MTGLHFVKRCQLIADSVDELRTFAQRLTNVPAVIWPPMEPHCQLDAAQRAQAVQLGAIECDEQQLEQMRRCMSGRTQRRA